jgi:crotonobetaine/carnitine-CoA ligase
LAEAARPSAGVAEESDESQTRHGARPVGRYHLLKLAESTRLRERRPLADQDLVEIMFTSGTTARPKGVMLTHANFVFSGTYVCWELALGPDDRYLTTMAATHVNLQLSALMPVIAAGATLILQRRYSARRFWRQARKHHATLVQGMAMIIRTLLLQPVDPQEREHWVRDVHYFLPLTDSEKQRFEERFGVRLLNNYGSTESLVGAITDLPSWPRRWPSIGRAGIGYQVRILTADGSEAIAGERGEIVIHGTPGRSLMAGYWNDPEATARAIDSEGWYHTGDIGTRDADGWFYFVDRKADLIKRSGENVSAAEVEGVLRGCPGVADVAVVGVPDEVRDEAVKAVVVPAGSDLSEEDVAAFARQHLACFKVPTIIEFRDELPRGEYGKVLKDLL